MAISTEQREFCDFVVERAQVIGPVDSRSMFGGFGLFLDGLMFGLIADNELYLKVDKQSRTEFIEEGLQAFAYVKNGKRMEMSYFQAPADCLESSEGMIEWGNRAFAAALRAAAAKRQA